MEDLTTSKLARAFMLQTLWAGLSCHRTTIPTAASLCYRLDHFDADDWPSAWPCDSYHDDCFHVLCPDSLDASDSGSPGSDCVSGATFAETYIADTSLEALARAGDDCETAGGDWWLANCNNDTGTSGDFDLVVGCLDPSGEP